MFPLCFFRVSSGCRIKLQGNIIMKMIMVKAETTIIMANLFPDEVKLVKSAKVTQHSR